MLRYNQPKLESFKDHVSSYRQGKISAGELVELVSTLLWSMSASMTKRKQFWSLFDVKALDLGKLIKELADLYEDEGKKQGLLKAWNNRKAIV